MEKLHPKQGLLRLQTEVPFSMAIVNVKLINECSPEHLGMGTAIMNCDKVTDKEGKKRPVKMEGCAKKRSPGGLIVARPTVPSVSQLQNVRDELPNKHSLQLKSVHYLLRGQMN